MVVKFKDYWQKFQILKVTTQKCNEKVLWNYNLIQMMKVNMNNNFDSINYNWKVVIFIHEKRRKKTPRKRKLWRETGNEQKSCSLEMREWETERNNKGSTLPLTLLWSKNFHKAQFFHAVSHFNSWIRCTRKNNLLDWKFKQ